MTRILALIAAVILIAAPSVAKPDRQVEFNPEIVAEITYGLICYRSEAVRVPASGTISGYVNQRDEAGAFILRTQTVPMDKGVSFGVQVVMTPGKVLRDVEISVRHPPHTDKQIEVETWVTDFLPDLANGGSFTFEYDYEQTPGLWIMEAAHQGEMIYSVAFNVTRESSVPGICNVEPLLG